MGTENFDVFFPLKHLGGGFFELKIFPTGYIYAANLNNLSFDYLYSYDLIPKELLNDSSTYGLRRPSVEDQVKQSFYDRGFSIENIFSKIPSKEEFFQKIRENLKK